MKNNGNNIMVEETLIRKMLSELKDIQTLSSERLLQQKIDLLIKYMENIVKYKNDEPFEDTIYKKMKEVRLDNPELNSKLYILYRKLSDGKITEEDARILYDVYIKSQAYDKLIY
ncbi:hypothetical protein PZQ55_001566 [Clostridium botulinum]|uniref:Uncharacterized protein n=2 Tax=Clostridium botulinum TaxID=1491 RepID=A0ABC8CQK5_CLOBO|nr:MULTISPECIES: hypothetical protein [Clostridium]AVQ37308.1 hypothetical protein C7M56_00925 [Clostridium botulinum]EKO1912520.1 hypothetical protein [Clostridium botulinum]EKO2042581.1 hypothetical protein [Clostridium botulinum]MBO0523309.1 hypothetical protein [Clostridium botulinum]MBO0529889.1 hypothetical protein [Clostridium botulinum]